MRSQALSEPLPAVDIALPSTMQPLASRDYWLCVIHGGRGSGKSWGVARFLIALAYTEADHLFLCCREHQVSIRQSVKRLLDQQIDDMGLRSWFTSTDTSIRCVVTGSEFIFAGLRHNAENIKSMEGISGCWIEEAQTCTQDSWEILAPTVRRDDAFFILTMNPRNADDYCYETFLAPPAEKLRKDVRRIELNYDGNPWFDQTSLAAQELHDREFNPTQHRHVWLGKLNENDESIVFKNLVNMDFETPDNTHFLFGADFGFSVDPATLIRLFFSEDEQTIYFDYAGGGVGIGLDAMPDFYDEIPASRDWTITADSSQPQTIDYLKKQNFRMKASRKGAKSRIEGVRFLQSKRLVFHTRCSEAYDEFSNFRYQLHKVTRRPIPDKVQDGDDHYIDAARYALEDAWMPRKNLKSLSGLVD